MKVLLTLKNKDSFGAFIGKLFITEDHFWLSARNFIITIVFIIWSLTYIIASSSYFTSTFLGDLGAKVSLKLKWEGIHDYTLKDDYGKIYQIKRKSEDLYDIIIDDRLVGKFRNNIIYKLNGEVLLKEVFLGENESQHISNSVSIDLERLLLKKTETLIRSKAKKEIDDRQVKVKKISNELDSLTKLTLENTQLAKKLFSDHGIDYDTFTSKTGNLSRLDNSIIDCFKRIREVLIKNNNSGYVGLFAKLALGGISIYRLESVYERMVSMKNIIGNLRDSDGNLKDLLTFDTYESLTDSLERLEDWNIANHFIRKFPPNQKKLIWKDGYFIDDLKSQSQSLFSSIKKLNGSEELSNQFFKKVSYFKTTSKLIESIYQITKIEPWTFDYWKKKIDSTRNVVTTWESKSDNQIICVVFTYKSIKELAYMTNWCIVRSKSYFTDYTNKGIQCILYDFNKPNTNNNSILGFTVRNEEIIFCHDKSDSRARLPGKFTGEKYDPTWDYHFHFRGNDNIHPNFLKFTYSNCMKKLDFSILKLIKSKIHKFLNNPKVSKFIDWYDKD